MVSTTTVLLAALAAVVSAAPGCKPPGPPGPPPPVLKYTLPNIGAGAAELIPPAANLVVKKIAVGHGIQNYTCGATTSNSTATGAVAVLYDVTSFYPGTPKTGIRQDLWDSLPPKLLWNTPLPLNKLVGSTYGADPNTPFPDPTADLKLQDVPAAKFVGHHFFDIAGVPTFDLAAAGLEAVVGKVDGKTAPQDADKGILSTGAVAWLKLDDTGKGLSQGVTSVFRVVTAGGNAESCSVAGAGVQSVPYAAFYWFFG